MADKGRVGSNERGEAVRTRILGASERLLRAGKAEFSMRDLAAAAGVSFATPFNHFGSKAAIMHALSDLRIDRMSALFGERPRSATARERLTVAADIAAAVMLDEPEVNKAVMSWLGAVHRDPGQAMRRSTALWSEALGDVRDAAGLAELMALSFRGALSFWTAGELPDEALRDTVLSAATRLAPRSD